MRLYEAQHSQDQMCAVTSVCRSVVSPKQMREHSCRRVSVARRVDLGHLRRTGGRRRLSHLLATMISRYPVNVLVSACGLKLRKFSAESCYFPGDGTLYFKPDIAIVLTQIPTASVYVMRLSSQTRSQLTVATGFTSSFAVNAYTVNF